jgi:uncharacterized protein YfaS (alpha-2-macroglobulin family)
MIHSRLLRLLSLAALVAAPSQTARAQDSVRVVRFSPEGLTSPGEPLVIRFDHPMSRGRRWSIDPSTITITPSVPTRLAWWDSTTLGVQFDPPWTLPGHTYEVRLNPRLRSLDGLPIARGSLSREVRVSRAFPLMINESRRGGHADTVLRPVVIYSAPVTLDELAGRAWLIPAPECGTSDALPLRPVSVEQFNPPDPRGALDTSSVARGPRPDTLRRLVEFVAPRALARGCQVTVRAISLDSAPEARGLLTRIDPPFGLNGNSCAVSAERCPAGPITLGFSHPVAAPEMRAHVRIDGRPVTISSSEPRTSWTVIDSARPHRVYSIEVDSTLRNVFGETLSQSTRLTFAIAEAPPPTTASASVPIATGARARDSLHVLRFSPAGHATAAEPVVVTFDRPVAPRLEQSVDPRRAVAIKPWVAERPFWRDPSTLVVEFTHLWEPDASYEVRLDSSLRSATGLPISRRDLVRTIRIARPVELAKAASWQGGDGDTILRPVAVYSGWVTPGQLAGRTWLEPDAACGTTDSLPLRVERTHPLGNAPSDWMREGGGADRDRRSDSLRFIVEFVAPRALARGCRVTMVTARLDSLPGVTRAMFRIRPRFTVTTSCPPSPQPCPLGPLSLNFTEMVPERELVAHVRVDGKLLTRTSNYELAYWTILAEVAPRSRHVIEVDSTLRSAHGEMLGRNVRLETVFDGLPPAVAFATGSRIVPRTDSVLLRFQYVNVDSLYIVARVPDSARVLAISDRPYGWLEYPTMWQRIPGDSIVLRVATQTAPDSSGTFALRVSDLPPAWRDAPLLVVRAVGVASPSAAPRVVAQTPWIGDENARQFALLRRTNLATHTWAGDGETHVWVTGLRDAQPRAGASVRLMNESGKELARASTDADGLATLRHAPSPESERRTRLLMLETRQGGDIEHRVFTEGNGYRGYDDFEDTDVAEMPLTELGMTTVHGAAFAERGIYRPGERVFLKGIVRRFSAASGYTIARGDSARWIVRWQSERMEAEKVWEHGTRLGVFGSSVDTFTVPRTARLGTYVATLSIRQAGRWRPAAHGSFAVAEYRVPEFAVSLSADTVKPTFAGDTATVRVDARYLFGVPMSGASLSWWSVTRESDPWSLKVQGLNGFSVGRQWWMLPNRQAPQTHRGAQRVPLDSSGRALLHLPVGAISRPGRVDVSVSVADANRQTVTSTMNMPVHVGELYIGARLAEQRWVWPVGTAIPMQSLVVGVDGARKEGVPVRMLALRYRWTGDSRTVDTLWRTNTVTTNDTLRVSFTPTESGLYELLFTANDPRGREAAAGVVVWVEDPRSRYARNDQWRLLLTADKPRYEPGESATIRVESPGDASAWLTLTREGILWQRIVQLHRGPNLLSVPLPDDAIPSARLDLVAIRPFDRDSTGRPFSVGSLALELGRTSRELRVALVPDRTRYRPGDRVRLTLHVRDSRGRGVRADAAVWAVDQGVASLTDLVKPDLLASLISMGSASLDFSTTLAQLIALTRPSLSIPVRGAVRIRGAVTSMSMSDVVRLEVPAPQAAGGRSGALDVALRQYFATTPFYRGSVITDARGDATLEFGLPDNLTTFRLFAAAAAGVTLAGSGDTAIVSTRTLAVRAALPRVIRDGDTLLAGALVTQERDGRSPVTLRAEGRGVRILGPTTRTDTLVGRRVREIRFSLAGIAGDTATLRFRGATRTDGDAVEAKLPVSPNGHSRAHVVMGTLEDTADIGFAIEDGLDTARSRLELQLGSSPAPLLRRLSESLRIYPYYCTEQLSSAGRALIARLRAERIADPQRSLTPQDRHQLETAVATLVARQREDGGIGYWDAAGWTSPWLTAYALDFLGGAREQGIGVPDGVFAKAQSYLSQRNPLELLSRYQNRGDTILSPHDALASALALRSTGHPDTALEHRVLARRESFTWVDRLTFAQLLAARGDSAEARRLLAEAWGATRTEGRRVVVDDSVAPRGWLFRSVTRPVATLLTTASALTPNDARLAPLFESLLQVGRSETRWSWNTVDQALVADAVSAMLRRPRAGTAVTQVYVSSGGRSLRTTTASDTRSDTLRLPLMSVMSRLEGRDSVHFTLRSTATRPVYFAATLFEVPRTRPVNGDDEGIIVERWYERYDDPRPVVSVNEGELVRVRIRVTVPSDREFVAIEDPLPAGLEAVDLSLRTSAALPPFQGASRNRAEENAEGPPGQRWLYGSWDAGWWTPWEHREIRDDRVLYFARQLWKGSYLVSYVARATTAGTFVRPPTHAEEMYNPALHGRSDGGVFTVTPLPH